MSTDDLNIIFLKLTNEAKASDKKDLEIIQHVLLGKLIAKNFNDINLESDKLFAEANCLVDKSKSTALKIWVQTQIGYYYYSFYEYEKASIYFFKSSKLIDDNLGIDLIQEVNVLKENAYFFYSIKEFNITIDYLKRALKLVPNTDPNYATFLNAIGTCYLEEKNLEKAFKYYNATINNFKITNDSLRYAKGLGDLAQIYILKKDYDKAEELLLKDIFISKATNNKQNTMFAQIRLGKLYITKGKYVQAKQILEEALTYIETNAKLIMYKFEVSLALLDITVAEKNTQKELILRREIDALKPIIDTTYGADALKLVAWNSQKTKTKWELEAEQSKVEKATFMKWMFVLISCLLFCFLLLLIMLFKRRLKIERISFENSLLSSELEKIKSETALNQANNSLSSFKVFLSEKNTQIKLLEKELLHLKEEKKDNVDQLKIENLLNSHLMTNENWRAFKNAFLNDESEFYNEIVSNYTDLSEANLRIILLQKIGLTNQETANLLGITIHGIKKAKQRMRKKYGENIESYI